jgi:hypothetical protein
MGIVRSAIATATAPPAHTTCTHTCLAPPARPAASSNPPAHPSRPPHRPPWVPHSTTIARSCSLPPPAPPTCSPALNPVLACPQAIFLRNLLNPAEFLFWATNACSCMLIANAPFVHASGRLVDCDSAVAWQIVICVSVRVCKRYIWILAVMRELLRCLFVAV